MAPADERECRQMLSTGLTIDGPSSVRYPRGRGPGVTPEKSLETLPIGKAEVRREGKKVALLAFGTMVEPAEIIAEELDATVVNMRFVKPLDEALIKEIAERHEKLITIEENVIAGGAGSAVAEALSAMGIERPLLHIGLPDSFIHHGERDEQLQLVGLDSNGIRNRITNWLNLEVASPATTQ